MKSAIRVIRKNLGLTQTELSFKLGIPINTIRNWEQEIRKTSDWIIDLCIDRLLREKAEHESLLETSKDVLSFLTLKNKISNLAKKYDVDRIYLFGSYAKGQADANSDIDLYMESNLYGLEYFEFAEALRNALNKSIELLSDKTIQRDSLIHREIKQTGVIIFERRGLHSTHHQFKSPSLE